LEAGKSRRERTLPMPVTTIDGLTDYLYSARPATLDRHVLVHHCAPAVGKGVQTSTVRGALRRAYARAGFLASESQVHRLRHTMAIRDSLAAVAMPWPRGSSDELDSTGRRLFITAPPAGLTVDN
jgi:integrase